MDEWLQLLANHPVFGAEDKAGGKAAGGAGAAPRERIAVRGTDLFVAVGSEVRWINLKACKDAFVRAEGKRMGLRSATNEGPKGEVTASSKQEAVRAVPWHRLGCEALSFDINRLAVNATGKLLAAIGSHQVAAVVLPSPGAAGKRPGGAFTAARLQSIDESGSSTGGWVDCRSMLLGLAPGASSRSKASGKGDRSGRRRSSGVGAGGMSVTANWSARLRVVDVLWHPLSTSDSHLLVLQANGSVKLFDVTEDVDAPEQSMSLFSSSGAGFAMSQATSFCMGSPTSSGWSRATLFVLTNTGELYSLCPVLPRRCSIDQEWVEDLLEIAEMDVREWQAEEYETSECIYTPPELLDARAAAKWLRQLIGLEKSRGSERLYLTLPPNLIQPVAAQGPYLFQPEPMPVDPAGYDSESSCSDSESNDGAGPSSAEVDPDDACSVLYMESPGGVGVGLVAIAYCDAHIEVFVDLEPVIGKWTDTVARGSHMRDLPVLATLASVDLTVAPLADDAQSKDSRQVGAVFLMPDTLSPTVFYALHTRGIHRADMRSWARLLDRAIGLNSEAGRSAALDQMVFALDGRGDPGSAEAGRGALARNSVQCIVHTNPSASRPAIPVVGAAVIDDIYLSYSLLALVEPCQLIGVALPLASDDADDTEDVGGGNVSDERENDEGADGGRRRLDLSLGAKNVVYVPRLPNGAYQAPASLADGGSGGLQQPRLVLRDDSRGEKGVSEERLKLLGSVVGQLRSQLAAVATAHTEMQERLDLQVQEHQRQHSKLSAISSGFLRHIEQMRQSQSRLDGLRDNGHKLALRVDQILCQVISHYQPELTPAERGFAEEIRGMDVQINGVDGYRQLVERLQARVSDMRALSNIATARANAEAKRAAAVGGLLGSSQPQLHKSALGKIEQMLDDEQSMIRETCDRIDELRDRVDCVPESQLEA
ncbi:hypothetical protein GGF46_000033 [Coemansia sp. RSA 552]|nr:hypothetical protein GGF46_000033 [Coemansia sp. RSA 552]